MFILLPYLLNTAITLYAPAPALPAWAQAQWTQAGLGNSFSLTSYANPGFLQADFNGDGKSDVALLVTRTATKSRGVIILHQGLEEYHVLGTGSGTAGSVLKSDLGWVDHWALYTKSVTYEILFSPAGDILDSRTVRLKRPAIEVTKEEQGGGMIYWNGKKYVWIHQTC